MVCGLPTDNEGHAVVSKRGGSTAGRTVAMRHDICAGAAAACDKTLEAVKAVKASHEARHLLFDNINDGSSGWRWQQRQANCGSWLAYDSGKSLDAIIVSTLYDRSTCANCWHSPNLSTQHRADHVIATAGAYGHQAGTGDRHKPGVIADGSGRRQPAAGIPRLCGNPAERHGQDDSSWRLSWQCISRQQLFLQRCVRAASAEGAVDLPAQHEESTVVKEDVQLIT